MQVVAVVALKTRLLMQVVLEVQGVVEGVEVQQEQLLLVQQTQVEVVAVVVPLLVVLVSLSSVTLIHTTQLLQPQAHLQ
jgi:hypothetical protein